MKRGDQGRSRTAGRIKRGGGNGGEPVRSPPGQTEISLAVWLILVMSSGVRTGSAAR
jgi:hypothetical protein